jgi:hypothetical protein
MSGSRHGHRACDRAATVRRTAGLNEFFCEAQCEQREAAVLHASNGVLK